MNLDWALASRIGACIFSVESTSQRAASLIIHSRSTEVDPFVDVQMKLALVIVELSDFFFGQTQHLLVLLVVHEHDQKFQVREWHPEVTDVEWLVHSSHG